ncbi:serine/threonine-protein phosphatase 7 isoform X1 [Spatholobus suberectus]|nr:serine/threonine-protein phosphatase 7 isoform X1 [Spatholobus suberectus]
MLDVEHVLRFENEIDEVRESLLPCFQQFLLWPSDNCVTLEWVQDMMFILEEASQKILPSEFCHTRKLSEVVDCTETMTNK